MAKVNHKELNKFLLKAYKEKLPAFISGGIGIGKSDTVRAVGLELAKELGKEYKEEVTNSEEDFCIIDRRVSQFDPTDLRGLPHEVNGKTAWLKPDFLPIKGYGIIFFDEANLAPPLVQSALYSLVNDRRLDDYRVPDGYMVVAAGNRVEDKSNVFEMSMALANRFFHVELKAPSIESWTDWAIKNKIDNRIVAFLNFKRALLYSINPETQELAQPTPRAWSKFAHNLIKDMNNKDIDELEMYVASAVGQGAAIEFASWVKMSEKVDIKELLNHPDRINDIDNLGLKYSVVSSLATMFSEDKKILPKVIKVCSIIEPEFAALLFRLAVGVDKQYILSNVTKVDDWKKFRNVVEKYI